MGLCFIVGNENNLIYPRWSRRVKYFSLFLLLTALILVITVNKLPPLTPHHLSSSTLNLLLSPQFYCLVALSTASILRMYSILSLNLSK